MIRHVAGAGVGSTVFLPVTMTVMDIISVEGELEWMPDLWTLPVAEEFDTLRRGSHWMTDSRFSHGATYTSLAWSGTNAYATPRDVRSLYFDSSMVGDEGFAEGSCGGFLFGGRGGFLFFPVYFSYPWTYISWDGIYSGVWFSRVVVNY